MEKTVRKVRRDSPFVDRASGRHTSSSVIVLTPTVRRSALLV